MRFLQGRWSWAQWFHASYTPSRATQVRRLTKSEGLASFPRSQRHGQRSSPPYPAAVASYGASVRFLNPDKLRFVMDGGWGWTSYYLNSIEICQSFRGGSLVFHPLYPPCSDAVALAQASSGGQGAALVWGAGIVFCPPLKLMLLGFHLLPGNVYLVSIRGVWFLERSQLSIYRSLEWVFLFYAVHFLFLHKLLLFYPSPLTNSPAF